MSAKELLLCCIALEKALPDFIRCSIDRAFSARMPCANALPLTSAAVALRIFALDRVLRYEDIPVDIKGDAVDYKPRVNFSPRCIISILCVKPMCHAGKCVLSTDPESASFSRISESYDLSTANAADGDYCGQADGTWPPFHRDGRGRPPKKKIMPVIMEDDIYRRKFLAQKGASIDSVNGGPDLARIQPYIPRSFEITSTACI